MHPVPEMELLLSILSLHPTKGDYVSPHGEAQWVCAKGFAGMDPVIILTYSYHFQTIIGKMNNLIYN